MISMFLVGLCSLLFVVLAIVIIKSRNNYKEIDKRYGKPYDAKVINMMGGHPELKQGSMAISFHPKDAIAFNHKVFEMSQISSIKILPESSKITNIKKKNDINSPIKEKFLCIVVKDKTGEHEIVFTASSEFEKIATNLMQKWKKYNLLC